MSLEQLPQPKALLFDLDGVLADVSRSYRQAVVETARFYGVPITHTEISAIKIRGNANNDWILTHRFLRERGIERSLAEVTERFEAFYQGDNASPGLWRHEGLLASVETVASLADRVVLGIVTGRPRKDAERFLDQHGILRFFRALICLEDGPSKPDPAPVHALRHALDMRTAPAWMIGDTVDDMQAAKAADVTAIGICAPGEDNPESIRALKEAGASHVLRSLDLLGEWSASWT